MGNHGNHRNRIQAGRPAGASRAYRAERPAGVRRWARLAQAGPLAVAAVSLTVLATACSGGGGPSTSGGSSPSGSARNGLLAYAQCMRAHGITKFPDPTAGGGIGLPDGVNPQSPQFVAAGQACKHLMPAGHPVPAAQQARIRAGNLKYAKCMRSHGISGMPDPASDGTLQVQASPGGDLDPASPRFQAADKACKHFQYTVPGSDSGGGLSSNGGS